MALAYIVGSVTQGGADAFAESEIATALSGQTGRAFRIRELLFERPFFSATGSSLELTLTRRTMAAIPLITDRNVIARLKWHAVITTSGAYQEQLVERLTFAEDDELLVVEDPLYFQIDSTSTTLTSTAYCRIGYELVNISANDRLQLALQSLNESA